jgi:hypothetical protein
MNFQTMSSFERASPRRGLAPPAIVSDKLPSEHIVRSLEMRLRHLNALEISTQIY